MTVFQARRKTHRYCQTNLAPPEQVFPLLCPVREVQWLDGWQHQMLYSESGFVEKGCIFSTSQDGEKDTLWVVTHYDRYAHEITFARFTPESRVCVLELYVEKAGARRSRVHIVYTYTALTTAGNQFIDSLTETTFLNTVRFWEKAINHYLTTGEKLNRTQMD